jgi:hypothetical protein
MNQPFSTTTPQPLIYNSNFDPTLISNILLIDINVKSYQQFVNSANMNTLAIVYYYSSQKTELLALLQSKFQSISRIGFVFDCSSDRSKTFLDQQPFFQSNEVEPYSSNLQFLINVVKEFGVKNMDFLACNTLNYPSWVNYYNILSNQTNVIVGASNDATGNIKHGGDWILESTSQNIELIYFTKSIRYYNYLLGNTANLVQFRFGYSAPISVNVYVLLTVDIANIPYGGPSLPHYSNNPWYGIFFNENGGPPPSVPDWITDFQLWYNGSQQYSFSDLQYIVYVLGHSSDPYDINNYNYQDSGVAFWTTDGNVFAPFWDWDYMSIRSLNYLPGPEPGDNGNSLVMDSFNGSPVNLDLLPGGGGGGNENPLCFLEGTKILVYKNEQFSYVPIEKLRKGDLVQTYKHGLVPIAKNGYLNLYHSKDTTNKANCLYRYAKNKNLDLYDDLVITGYHSVLVPRFTDKQREETKKLFGKIYLTEEYARLASCLDERAELLEKEGNYRVYHLALQNEHIHKNYGIYANGMFTESTSLSMFDKGGFTEIQEPKKIDQKNDVCGLENHCEQGVETCEWI